MIISNAVRQLDVLTNSIEQARRPDHQQQIWIQQLRQLGRKQLSKKQSRISLIHGNGGITQLTMR